MMDLVPLARALAGAAVSDPWKEVRLLWAAAKGVPYASVLGCKHAEGTSEEEAKLQAYVARRCRREPITKILQRASFWTFTVATSEATLDPRPESEILIEAVCSRYTDRSAPLRFCDLGTGTGCLLLACLSEYSAATGLGVDISAGALAVAEKNAELLGLSARARWRLGAWCAPLTERFDVVVSNPPYIRTDAALPPEVLFDPPEALFAGADGLEAYRQICAEIAQHLAARGRLFLEIGQGQEDAVKAIAEAHGLRLCEALPDLAGITRVLVLTSRRGAALSRIS